MPSILSRPENEFDFFNVQFPRFSEFGDTQLKSFWLPTDVHYKDDGRDFDTLDKPTQHFIERTIGFFFSSDGIVFKNIGENFKNEFHLPEIQYTYSAFEIIELIHSKSYGLQLDAIVRDPKRKKELMMAIVNIPSIKALADWALKYMNRDKYSLTERMIAFLCVEGIFFSSPFATIFWVRKYHPGKLKGIVGANDLISRDENLHAETAVALIIQLILEGFTTTRAIEIIRSAVDVSLEFVKDSLPDGLIGMNVDLMSRHVKSVANRWGMMIGLSIDDLYPDCKSTPFAFMENISLDVKKNMFEKDTTEYQKAPPMDSIDFTGGNLDDF